MRITRLIAVVVAFVLTALAPIALTSQASSAATAAEQAKPKHSLFASGKEIRNTNKFITFGRVSTYKNRNVTIQRKNCGTCAGSSTRRPRPAQTRASSAPGSRRASAAPASATW